ncbi:PadR family transcriptional regulator [Vagococcus sp.]|uniref:PadR family transcriptional regulator n=1 Tax=Vagococcus sp. TaxID=1933889 RepID=UPI003F9D4286
MEPLTDLNYLILLTLLEPKHGYAIMQDVSDLTQDEVTIGPASMYTILKKLEKANDIQLETTVERKKTYLITAQGHEKLIADVKRRERLTRLGKKLLSREEADS